MLKHSMFLFFSFFSLSVFAMLEYPKWVTNASSIRVTFKGPIQDGGYLRSDHDDITGQTTVLKVKEQVKSSLVRNNIPVNKLQLVALHTSWNTLWLYEKMTIPLADTMFIKDAMTLFNTAHFGLLRIESETIT